MSTKKISKQHEIKQNKIQKNKRNTLKTDLSIFTINNVLKNLFSMKIAKVISFLLVNVRKMKDEQINK